MLYIPIKHLKPGMTLARSVSGSHFYLPLLTKGHTLTNLSIQKLATHAIPGVYVECAASEGIVTEEFLAPELKQQMLSEIKDQYQNYAKQSVASASFHRSILDMSTELVLYILSKDDMLLNMLDIRNYDSYTYSHSMYVGLISVLMGVQLGFPKETLIELAMSGLLHDIGKLDIPSEIINKPGPLTPAEFALIKMHPMNAVNRLRPNHAFSFTVLSGIETHHEKYDGSGYPHKLTGGDIPLFGRILALADVYDALISVRSYRSSWSPGQAVEYMMGCAGIHFDLELLKLFLHIVAAYPNGTLVQLSNGYLAIVARNNQGQTLRPVVRVLQPESHRNEEIDLSNDPAYFNVTVTDVISEDTLLPDSLFR